MRRAAVGGVLGLALVVGPQPLAAQEASGLVEMNIDHMFINEASVDQVSQARGYLMAQDLSIEILSYQHPGLGHEFQVARMMMQARFGFPLERTTRFLQAALGERYDETVAKWQTYLDDQLGGDYSAEEARDFLAQMQARAAGEVDPPVIETFLWLLYNDHPLSEVTDGWTERFSTDGHPKSLGLDMTLQVPRSWSNQEGERPHIVQKWISQNGAGDLNLMVLLNQMEPGPPVTEADVEDLIATGGVAEAFMPEGYDLLDSASVMVDRQPGLRLDYSGRGRNLDREIVLLVRSYVLFAGDVMVQFQCQAGELPDRMDLLGQRFNDLKPLCDRVAGSIVFPSTYE